MQTTDAELVKGCLAGDHRAWETIVRQYNQRIYNLAYRFTGRFDEAEDLTQEIFLKVYRTLSSYRPESGALVTWISPVITGTKDRVRRNQQTMIVTLERLAAALENT